MFGNLFRKDKERHYEIIFGKAASALGEHGALVGTWKSEGYRENITISFYIKGHEPAPVLSLLLHQEILEQAQMNGIVPKHLYSYSGIMPAMKKAA